MKNNMEEKKKIPIKRLIEKALDKLYKEDYNSLICINHEKHVGERACVFRFGIYFNQILKRYKQFNGYNLDCEYNRNNNAPKRNNDGNLIVPDIILHKRGNNDNNLVVIEFKGWWSQESQKKDISKLNDLVDPNGIYKYKYGYSIKFNNVEIGTDRYNITEVKCNILD